MANPTLTAEALAAQARPIVDTSAAAHAAPMTDASSPRAGGVASTAPR